MKLAFSTLGCPNWDEKQILGAAREHGYQGVELRFFRGSLDLPKVLAELPGGARGFAHQFGAAGVEICCLDSSVVLSKAEADVSEGERMIGLATELGAPYVRVFGGEVPEGESLESCRARAADKLARLGRYGEGRGVRVLLETHDAFSTGESVAALLAAAGEAGTGVIWDVHHPHAHGEPLEKTIALIGHRTYHVHVKDGKEDGTLTLLGEGDLPLRDQLAALRDLGYAGYLSLEWEKAWHPEIPDPEIAFPHAASYLRQVCGELGIALG
jgi:sugar phosphate isomerase/epimerase